ncbi:GNAT family N-acetyltransferase [Shewanella sedimentimangrovi]|uniref:GNAT family N-acetyltransferase n=1 Tax=Shewanella sedimentimangrovi TaxID=2814293 RepID=A0ABX7QYR4_9GAMM|nr:GNAT family N-acetyltransferase [Shewanella sedimentimangrovi]QSX36202.1 GNAT family N-acetyltransferase [Shewanella sedimentimangrovi]
MELEITAARSPEDFDAAIALLQSRDDNHHPLDPEQLRRARLLLLARQQGQLLGCAAIKAGTGEVGELGYLMVAPGSRRSGIAKSLTQARMAAAREMGLSLLFATVRAENSASRDNLLRAGWQFFGDYLSIRGTGNRIGWYFFPLKADIDALALMQQQVGDRVRLCNPE